MSTGEDARMTIDSPWRDGMPNRGRRTFLLSAMSLAVLAALDPLAIARAVGSAEGDSAALGDFMAVSRLVASGSLDPITGAALCHALQRRDAAFETHLQTLAQHVRAMPGLTVEALAADLDRRGEVAPRAALNQIVSAWYLGVVDDHVYAYEGALMFRVTADVLSPPSYAHGGPLNWAESDPPIR